MLCNSRGQRCKKYQFTIRNCFLVSSVFGHQYVVYITPNMATATKSQDVFIAVPGLYSYTPQLGLTMCSEMSTVNYQNQRPDGFT